jgi:hypothetical protein
MAHKQELSASADENLTPACACSRKMQIYRGEKVFILALLFYLWASQLHVRNNNNLNPGESVMRCTSNRREIYCCKIKSYGRPFAISSSVKNSKLHIVA